MLKDEIKEIAQFDATLEKSLEDFMESYKMVDVDQVYSNGIEFVPIFRIKQWLEYNNITNLQEENKMYAQLKEEYEDIIDKAVEYIENDTTLNPQRQRERLLNILAGGDSDE